MCHRRRRCRTRAVRLAHAPTSVTFRTDWVPGVRTFGPWVKAG